MIYLIEYDDGFDSHSIEQLVQSTTTNIDIKKLFNQWQQIIDKNPTWEYITFSSWLIQSGKVSKINFKTFNTMSAKLY